MISHIKNVVDASINTKPFRLEGMRKASHYGKGKFIAIPLTVDADWLKIKKYIREKSVSWGTQFTDELIEEKITRLVFELKHDDKKYSQIGKIVNGWIDELKKIKLNEYTYIRPIHYLKIKNEIDFKKVKIVKLSKRITDSLIDASTRNNDPRYPKILEEIIKTNETDVFGLIKLKATDRSQAEKNSKEYLEMALNAIRIFYHKVPIMQGEDYVGLRHHSTLEIENRTNYSEDFSNLNLHLALNLDSKTKKKFESLWKILIPFLFTTNPTQMQERILVALDWYGQALKERTSYSSFLKFITALESLLIFDKEFQKADKIAERLSTIIYSKHSYKQESFELMREYYKKRSGIVHAGKTMVHPEDLQQIKTWSQYLIQLFIRKSTKYSDVSSFLTKEYSLQI